MRSKVELYQTSLKERNQIMLYQTFKKKKKKGIFIIIILQFFRIY